MTTPFGFPSELYHVLLDEQPHYLAPTHALRVQAPTADLIVNPRCWFAWQGALPPDKAARAAFAEYFCPSDWMVWVDDPATGILWPFWVGDEYMAYLAYMAPGYPAPNGLPPQVEWVLREANILVALSDEAHRRQDHLRASRRNADRFERGYAVLTDLVHPFHIAALRRYFRYHTRAGSFELGDTQVGRRYAAYNEAVSCFFHYQFTPLLSQIAASALKPTYAYFTAYQGEAELPPHVDREACEYSVSLCLDATPEPEGRNPWSFDLQTEEGVLRIWQNFGDGVLYRGRYLPHSRGRLPAGYSSSSLLLHYVDEHYQGSLQ